MATTTITRAGVARRAALSAAVGIMTVGFAVLSTTVSEATTLATSHRVEPAGISELWTVSCPTVAHCVAAGTATGSTPSSRIAGFTTTVNGGASWSKGTIHGGPGNIGAIACATNKKCVGVGAAGSTPFTYTPGIVVTSDGGVSWTGQILANAAGGLSGVSCPSPTRCVAVGSSFGSSGPDASLVFVSSDAGASWAPGTLPSGITGLEAVSCPSTKFCLAVGNSAPTGGSSAAVIDAISSKDGGSSWTTAPSPGMGSVNALSCANARVCVAIGSSTGVTGSAQTLSTKNGGAAWSVSTIPHGMKYLLNVTCPTARRCVAVGYLGNPFQGKNVPPGAMYSLNGGRSWSLGTLPASKASSINAVACSTAIRCVAVGSSSGLNGTAKTNYTTNGGKTWSK